MMNRFKFLSQVLIVVLFANTSFSKAGKYLTENENNSPSLSKKQLASTKDTLLIEKLRNGGKKVHIYGETDSTEIAYYPDGTIEYKLPIITKNKTYSYCRFYPNGQKMWEREMYSGVPHGKMRLYFDNKEICRLIYDKGEIKKTIVKNNQYRILLGQFTYNHTVIPGIDIGIRKESGNKAHFPLTLVDTDPKNQEEPWEMNTFTDMNGEFIFVIDQKKRMYGLFRPDVPNLEIANNSQVPKDYHLRGSHAEWMVSPDLHNLPKGPLIKVNFQENSTFIMD